MFAGIIARTERKQDCIFLLICCLAFLVASSSGVSAPASVNSEVSVSLIKPDPRGGIGYKLVYFIDVPLDTYWRFKTDFESSYLATNKLIKDHRCLRQEENTVVTETKYTIGPDVTYLWLYKIFNSRYRLEYTLLNPEECGQCFHYGHIQAAAAGNKTKVTQRAYFNFFGVSLWAHYPWRGGMLDCLKYAARWEQKAAQWLEWKYESKEK